MKEPFDCIRGLGVKVKSPNGLTHLFRTEVFNGREQAEEAMLSARRLYPGSSVTIVRVTVNAFEEAEA